MLINGFLIFDKIKDTLLNMDNLGIICFVALLVYLAFSFAKIGEQDIKSIASNHWNTFNLERSRYGRSRITSYRLVILFVHMR